MAAIPEGVDVPWHRVVNSRGEISARSDGNGDSAQKRLLISEGIIFDKNGKIDFEKYSWAEAELPFWPEDFADDLKV